MSWPSTGAFLALWNGIHDPRMQAEYEAWHAFEHVPERVGTPGISWAARYVASATAAPGQPAYFTLYGLESIAVLSTPRYQALIDEPTPWSRRMRSALSDFCREPCDVLGLYGNTLASRLAALRLRVGTGADVDGPLRQLVRSGSALAACWGRVDAQSIHPLSLGTRTDSHTAPATASDAGLDAVVLVQHLRDDALLAATRELLEALGPAVTLRAPLSRYELQSVVRQGDLAHAPTPRQPARPDLQKRFTPGDLSR